MLEIKNLNVELGEGKDRAQILNDINLTFEKKKIYVITGPNGGGKSSIAKTIMGIHQPTSGSILLDGEDIAHKEIYERAQMGIGYSFQQPARFKGIKVDDLLSLASGGIKHSQMCDLLYDVGLCAADVLDREINSTFSGGELKRIEIATNLARNLKVAIFDEPEAGIDLWSFQKLVETFRSINDKYDTTVVIISHQERIFELADEIILVRDGKVSEITTTDKILTDIQMLDSDCRCRQDCSRGGRVIAQRD